MNPPCQARESEAGRETPSSKFFSEPAGLLDHMNLRHYPSDQPEVTVCEILC
jgi:hypothetical protein